MSAPPPELTYAVVTAARNEADNLPRLAASLAAQSVTPSTWVIVENGSSDDTLRISDELSEKHDWVRVLTLGEPGPQERGAPIVRAIEAAIETLGDDSDVVVNVDADVSMDEQFFAQILEAFARDPELGICSGIAYELGGEGAWNPRFVTGGSIWGATRAYRRACLDDVLPFERRHGWDGMDQLRARSKGWTTRVLDLPFLHHRREGEREGSRWAHWTVVGESSYYMGYRFWYLLLRAAHQTRHDASAVAMVWGFVSSIARRRPRWHDAAAREVLRRDQRLTTLGARRREALGADRRSTEPRG